MDALGLPGNHCLRVPVNPCLSGRVGAPFSGHGRRAAVLRLSANEASGVERPVLGLGSREVVGALHPFWNIARFPTPRQLPRLLKPASGFVVEVEVRLIGWIRALGTKNASLFTGSILTPTTRHRVHDELPYDQPLAPLPLARMYSPVGDLSRNLYGVFCLPRAPCWRCTRGVAFGAFSGP